MYMNRSAARGKAKHETTGASYVIRVVLNDFSFVTEHGVFDFTDENTPLYKSA